MRLGRHFGSASSSLNSDFSDLSAGRQALPNWKINITQSSYYFSPFNLALGWVNINMETRMHAVFDFFKKKGKMHTHLWTVTHGRICTYHSMSITSAIFLRLQYTYFFYSVGSIRENINKSKSVIRVVHWQVMCWHNRRKTYLIDSV